MNQLFQDFNKILPIELVYIIFRYTYHKQSPILLDDIENYPSSLKICLESYKKRFFYERNQDEYINWLENHIIRYANNNISTFSGPNPKMLDILGRFFLQKNKIKDIVLLYNFQVSAKRNTNIFWGIFTHLERDEFISIFMQN
jgi:hypothetical protein